jgi:electron transport complex protein RnfB
MAAPGTRKGRRVIDGRVLVAIGLVGIVVAFVMTVVSMRRAQRETQMYRMVAAVLKALPGGNCGLCGNDSCYVTARAIASGRVPLSACVAGGEATAAAVEASLGLLDSSD